MSDFLKNFFSFRNKASHTGFCVAWLEHNLEFLQNTLKR